MKERVGSGVKDAVRAMACLRVYRKLGIEGGHRLRVTGAILTSGLVSEKRIWFLGGGGGVKNAGKGREGTGGTRSDTVIDAGAGQARAKKRVRVNEEWKPGRTGVW